MTRPYPRITRDALNPFIAVFGAMGDDPDYLEHPDCPYGPPVKDWLKAHRGTSRSAPPVASDPTTVDDPDGWADVNRKARKLYAELDGLDVEGVSDAIQVIKTKVSLLERLIGVGEKALGHRETAEFRRMVLAALEEAMAPDQRTTFMAKLEARNA